MRCVGYLYDKGWKHYEAELVATILNRMRRLFTYRDCFNQYDKVWRVIFNKVVKQWYYDYIERFIFNPEERIKIEQGIFYQIEEFMTDHKKWLTSKLYLNSDYISIVRQGVVYVEPTYTYCED